MKSCSPWKGLVLEKFMGRDPMLEQGKRGGDPAPEEGGVAEACPQVTQPPLLILLQHRWEGDREKLTKIKKEGAGGKVF